MRQSLGKTATVPNGAAVPTGSAGLDMDATFGSNRVSTFAVTASLTGSGSASGIFILWGTIGSAWSVARRLNGGGVVEGGDPTAETFVEENLGLYGRLYCQTADLSGTPAVAITEIIQPGD